LADFGFCATAIKNAGKADNGRAAFAGKVTERVQYKGKVGFGFGGEYARRGKAVVVDEGGIVAADPFYGIGRIGDDGVKGLVAVKMGGDEGVPQLDVEFVVIDVVQEHIHPRQVVGGVVEFLPVKPVFDNVRIKVLFGLQ
jgi:hypothetical protein